MAKIHEIIQDINWVGVITYILVISFIVLFFWNASDDINECEELGFDSYDLNKCIKKTSYDRTTGRYSKCYMPIDEGIHADIWCRE